MEKVSPRGKTGARMASERYNNWARRRNRTGAWALARDRAAGMTRGAGPSRETGKVRREGRPVRANGPGASCVAVTTLRVTAKAEERARAPQRAASCVGGHTLRVNAGRGAKRRGRREYVKWNSVRAPWAACSMSV